MKRFMQFGLLAVVAALLATPAFAQGKFDLKKESGPDVQPLLTHATQYVALKTAKAAGVELPAGLSATAQYGSFFVGGQKVSVVLDGNSLYVDVKDRLKDAKPLLNTGKPMPITVAPPGGSVTVIITVPTVKSEYFFLQPAEALIATVQLGGKSYQVAAADATLTAKWNNTFSPAKTGPNTADIFAIDLNGNGKFDDAPEAGEIVPLGKAIQVAGVWYAYEVAADGSAVTFKKFDGDQGTISAPGNNLSLILSSDYGITTVTGSAGLFSVPAGNYAVAGLLLATTDKDGAKWTLMANCSRDLGKIAKGDTKDLKVGQPLLVKADATRAGADVTIGCSILGQSGEPYSAGVSKNGTQQESPKFKIVDEAGKVLATDQFHYG